MTPLSSREYGGSGPEVVLLHGGPGAAGYLAPVARELAGSFRVLEPFQRGSGAEPLTVARHVEDLSELLRSRGPGARPRVVGHSWGAMLALAFAAAHTGDVHSLALIGCGTFDVPSRLRMRAMIDRRMDEKLRRRMHALPQELPDPDERLRVTADLVLPSYSHELRTTDQEIESCDGEAHRESWDDMLRLQAEGTYPAAFRAIRTPVLMLHGAVDPHPGSMIRASLEPYLPQIDYRELECCGHYPWMETHARDEFFRVLREWLSA